MSTEIENRLIKLIANQADVESDTITPEMSVTETGIDSIGVAELLFDIEEDFDITLENPEELQNRFELGTISELAAKLANQINKN